MISLQLTPSQTELVAQSLQNLQRTAGETLEAIATQARAQLQTAPGSDPDPTDVA